jgi:hypothetical protein
MNAFAYERDTTFECPDDKTFQFLDIAHNPRGAKYGFKDEIGAYSYVIENANRPMDEVALRSACSRLAHYSYMDEHHRGGNPHGLIPPKEAIGSLRNKHPILSRCSDHSLYRSELPIRRANYVPPKEAVRLGITGWVDLELDLNDNGIAESIRVVDSSNAILERVAVEHVRTFQYPKSSHLIGYSMVRKGLQIRITTDYFHIAQANGCRLESR